MTKNKRFRMEIIEGASLPFIVDNDSAKKQGNKIKSYHIYETHRKDKCLELVDLLNALHEENEQLNDTVDNVSNHLQRELEKNIELNRTIKKLSNERNYFERKKTEYLTKLNECKLENADLKNKYDTETEHLIKENVKLKQEFGDYKKNIRRIMDIKKELDNDKCKHSK